RYGRGGMRLRGYGVRPRADPLPLAAVPHLNCYPKALRYWVERDAPVGWIRTLGAPHLVQMPQHSCPRAAESFERAPVMRARFQGNPDTGEAAAVLVGTLHPKAHERPGLVRPRLLRGGLPMLVQGEPHRRPLVLWYIQRGRADLAVLDDPGEIRSGCVVPRELHFGLPPCARNGLHIGPNRYVSPDR